MVTSIGDNARSTVALDGIIAGEAVELDRLLNLYRLLPFGAYPSPEAIRITDVVADAVAFAANLADSGQGSHVVEDDPDTPPVLMDPTALTQAVVLLLVAAARHQSVGPDARALELRVAGTPDWVTVSAEATHPITPHGVDVPAELVAAQWLIRDAEGSVSLVRGGLGGVRAEMRLATLARMRARG
jgi:hypothetical protein